jgi:hypothetical protein
MTEVLPVQNADMAGRRHLERKGLTDALDAKATPSIVQMISAVLELAHIVEIQGNLAAAGGINENLYTEYIDRRS